MKMDYEQTKWWKEHKVFVKEIKAGKIPFFKNDGKPLKEWKLFETRAAARDAAWDAAWDAARAAAWDAAWDAALFTRVTHICSGLKLDAKFRIHAKARWQVWTKGYCLLCDINGKLYVYKKP
jgi:hypothetical protein